MPYYRGIDYWQQVLEERREFFSCALLKLPTQLCDRDSNNQDGIKKLSSALMVSMTSYADSEPCKYVPSCEDSNSIQVIKGNVIGSLSVSCEISTDICDCKPETYQINDCDTDIVASSDSELTEELNCRNVRDAVEELFEKEDLNMYKDHKRSLEVITTSSALGQMQAVIPDVSTLIRQLQAKTVKDPLANSHACLEAYGVSNNFIFEENTHVRGSADNSKWFETFERNTIISCIEGELEEPECCVCTTEEERANSLMHTALFGVHCFECKEYKHITIPEGGMHLDTGFVSNCGIEKAAMKIYVVDTLAAIMDISKQYLGDVALEYYLEVPVLIPDDDKISNYILESLGQIQPLPTTSSCRYLLSECQQKAVISNIWNQEKLRDEVTTLLLPEPETDVAMVSLHNTWEDFVQQLKHLEEQCLGSTDLMLCWDPWSSCPISTTTKMQVEDINLETSKVVWKNQEKEQFEKYTQFELQVSGQCDTNGDDVLHDDVTYTPASSNTFYFHHVPKAIRSKRPTISAESDPVKDCCRTDSSCINTKLKGTSCNEDTRNTTNLKISETLPFQVDPLQEFLLLRMSNTST